MKNPVLLFIVLIFSNVLWAKGDSFEETHLRNHLQSYLTEPSVAGLDGLQSELARTQEDLKITLISGQVIDLKTAKQQVAQGASVTVTFKSGEKVVYPVQIAPTSEAMKLIRQGMQGRGATGFEINR